MKIQSHQGPYYVEFVDDFIKQFKNWDFGRSHFIVDRKVAQLYSEQLKPVLEAPSVLLLEANEENKSLENLSDYVEFLVNNKIRRDHTLVAIGGGIMQDITSFLATTMLRGLDWCFFPTTLLAQSDSCIGSKSSINCRGTKNILGTFKPPKQIYLSTNFLATLKLEELKSGVGEMLKVHAIAGPSDFLLISTEYNELFSSSKILLKTIRRSLEIKKKFVEKDEFDQGSRLVFNYGHSFGHAIEAATNFAIPHGIAVSIGCDMANYCASRLGVSNEKIWGSMSNTFRKNYQGYEAINIPFELFISALDKDKKNIGKGSFSLILPNQKAKLFRDSYSNNLALRGIFKDFFAVLKD